MKPVECLKPSNCFVRKPSHKTDQHETGRSLPELVCSRWHLFRFSCTKLLLSPWGINRKLIQFSRESATSCDRIWLYECEMTLLQKAPRSRDQDFDLFSVTCLVMWHLGLPSHLLLFSSGASNKKEQRCRGMLPSSQNTKELGYY